MLLNVDNVLTGFIEGVQTFGEYCYQNRIFMSKMEVLSGKYRLRNKTHKQQHNT